MVSMWVVLVVVTAVNGRRSQAQVGCKSLQVVSHFMVPSVWWLVTVQVGVPCGVKVTAEDEDPLVVDEVREVTGDVLEEAGGRGAVVSAVSSAGIAVYVSQEEAFAFGRLKLEELSPAVVQDEVAGLARRPGGGC